MNFISTGYIYQKKLPVRTFPVMQCNKHRGSVPYGFSLCAPLVNESDKCLLYSHFVLMFKGVVHSKMTNLLGFTNPLVSFFNRTQKELI